MRKLIDAYCKRQGNLKSKAPCPFPLLPRVCSRTLAGLLRPLHFRINKKIPARFLLQQRLPMLFASRFLSIYRPQQRFFAKDAILPPLPILIPLLLSIHSCKYARLVRGQVSQHRLFDFCLTAKQFPKKIPQVRSRQSPKSIVFIHNESQPAFVPG